MSDIPKSKRRKTDFEVQHHFQYMLNRITDLLLRNFGFSEDKANKALLKRIGGTDYDSMNESQRLNFGKTALRIDSFDEWFIDKMRNVIFEQTLSIGTNIQTANSIYATCVAEAQERRIFQDKAIAECENLNTALQYAANTLPSCKNAYMELSLIIEEQIKLIKGWRTSDNRKYNKLEVDQFGRFKTPIK